jgi:hypothetical protein
MDTARLSLLRAQQFAVNNAGRRVRLREADSGWMPTPTGRLIGWCSGAGGTSVLFVGHVLVELVGATEPGEGWALDKGQKDYALTLVVSDVAPETRCWWVPHEKLVVSDE